MPDAELADVARPDEQLVGRHLGLGRVVAERREEELGQAHGRSRIPGGDRPAGSRAPRAAASRSLASR